MKMVKFIVVSVMLILAFGLGGCQGTNSDAPVSAPGFDENTTTPAPPSFDPDQTHLQTLILSKDILVPQDSASEEALKILGYNNEGTTDVTTDIYVQFPQNILAKNIDIGYIQPVIHLVNGIAEFKYKAPDNIALTMQKLHDAQLSDSVVIRFIDPQTGTQTNLTLRFEAKKIEVPNLILKNSAFTLTNNSQAVEIEIDVLSSVTNTPYSEGNVSVIYPQDVKDGVDVGYFEKTTLPVTNGKVVFHYIGPKNLLDLKDKNITSSQFWFYHNSYYSKDHNITFVYEPDENKSIVLEDYMIASNLESENITMGLESSKNISFSIKNDKGELVADDKINEVTVELLNPKLGVLKDSAGNEQTVLSEKNKSVIGFLLESHTISGVIPIKVTATFKDANDKDTTLTKVFNVVVLSGPPTAMSISYVGTTQDKDTAKFVEKMNVLLTDKYNNPVNTNPALSVALISGYHNDPSGPLGYMYHTGVGTLDGSSFDVPQGIVTKAQITNPGKDYKFPPKVSLSGGDGTFKAQAVLMQKGSVYKVDVLNGGYGYTQKPSVSISGSGSGFDATAQLDLDKGSFKEITIVNSGSGYTSAPTVSGNGGTGLVAHAVLEDKGSLKSYTIENAGSDFEIGDTFKIYGDGSGAVLKVTDVDDNGAITELTIFDKGEGYTYANIDTTTLENREMPDSDVRISLTIGYGVDHVEIVDGGHDYTDSTIVFSTEAGAIAPTASATLIYPLKSITVLNGGYGYDNSATVTIEGDGYDAVATADVRYSVAYIEILDGGTGYTNGASLDVDNSLSGGSGLSATAVVFENFNSIDISNEYLATFGDGYTYGASGKWDIANINPNSLTLVDTYEGDPTNNLSFAVGNNHRQDRCIDGREWVTTATINGDSRFDSNGFASFEVTYDYYMTAKDIIMMVNLVGTQNDIDKTLRVGEAIKHTLRGTGLSAPSVQVPSGTQYVTYRMYVSQADTAEPLRNANFVYNLYASNGVIVHKIEDSMMLGIDQCGIDDNGNKLEGRAYVDVTVSSATGGNLELRNLIIAKEFK